MGLRCCRSPWRPRSGRVLPACRRRRVPAGRGRGAGGRHGRRGSGRPGADRRLRSPHRQRPLPGHPVRRLPHGGGGARLRRPRCRRRGPVAGPPRTGDADEPGPPADPSRLAARHRRQPGPHPQPGPGRCRRGRPEPPRDPAGGRPSHPGGRRSAAACRRDPPPALHRACGAAVGGRGRDPPAGGRPLPARAARTARDDQRRARGTARLARQRPVADADLRVLERELDHEESLLPG